MKNLDKLFRKEPYTFTRMRGENILFTRYFDDASGFTVLEEIPLKVLMEPIRQWLEFCINKIEGYEVVGAASNGAEGYSIFRKSLPDIVITDIRMPGMDGLEMLKMIRSLNHMVYSAVLTSHEDFEYARQAIKLGTSEYILKTEITEENLRQILEKGKRAVKAASGGGQEKHLEEALNRNHYLRSLVLSHKPEKANEALLRDFNIFPEKGEFVALVLKTREGGPLGTELPEEGPFEHMIKIPLELNYTALLGSFCRDISASRHLRLQEVQSYCRLVLTHAPGWMGCSDLYENPERMGDAMRQAFDRAKLSFLPSQGFPFLHRKYRQIPVDGW